MIFMFLPQFLGHTEVDQPKGTEVVRDAVRKLKVSYCSFTLPAHIWRQEVVFLLRGCNIRTLQLFQTFSGGSQFTCLMMHRSFNLINPPLSVLHYHL